MKPFELTHLLSVSAVQPILPVMDSIAAHCDAYWSLASRTMRTARSITSGENFGDFHFLAPFLIEEPPREPGRFRTILLALRLKSATSSARQYPGRSCAARTLKVRRAAVRWAGSCPGP
jgi:hypothetical protein